MSHIFPAIYFFILFLFSQNIYFVIFLPFLIYWGLFYVLAYGLSWKMFHEYMKILDVLLLCGVFFRCLLVLVGVEHCKVFYFLVDLLLFDMLLKVGNCMLELLLFSISLFIFVWHIWLSVIKFINVYNCYVFLIDWAFYFYKTLFWLIFNSQVYFIWY